MEITTIGLDLAKGIFQVHGVDETGQVVVRKLLRRAQMLSFFVPGRYGSGRYFALLGRELIKLGHEVRLMLPAYVKPYVGGWWKLSKAYDSLRSRVEYSA